MKPPSCHKSPVPRMRLSRASDLRPTEAATPTALALGYTDAYSVGIGLLERVNRPEVLAGVGADTDDIPRPARQAVAATGY
ncbi:MAG: hypothetical protein JOZ49_03385 [Mycolicibacterium sp.]|nr:hypothetical protein [Mycolicibacterium sp.]